jgi:two-component system chemotaxis response regulator CheB
VRELRQGDRVADDLVLVAPGDTHVVVDGAGTIELVTSALVNGVRPAADVTLLAAAPAWRSRLLSVVLTGMGHDGTNGSRAVRANGGFVIAQDEATSAVFGMPRSVAEADLADRVLPLDRIAEAIVAWARGADSVAGAAYLLKTRATTDT